VLRCAVLPSPAWSSWRLFDVMCCPLPLPSPPQFLGLDACRALTNLSALPGLPRLEELSLESCETLVDLRPLSECPALVSLWGVGSSSEGRGGEGRTRSRRPQAARTCWCVPSGACTSACASSAPAAHTLTLTRTHTRTHTVAAQRALASPASPTVVKEIEMLRCSG
jgi:hypothetical protein